MVVANQISRQVMKPMLLVVISFYFLKKEMIQNNLDHAVAQHPHELITYGGTGAVFQNW